MATAMPVAVTAVGPSVSTQAGVVVGTALANGVDEFVGIPYAAAPNTSALRWQPPMAPQPWSTPLQATRFGAVCAQTNTKAGAAVWQGSEDCLTLNVWRPRPRAGVTDAAAGPLPVMVWIHGGGFEYGSSSLYNASRLVGGLARRVVVVSMNYRLSVFGFLANKDLAKHSGGTTGLYGLLDQRFALQWTKRNVAAFGGDPNSVTVFGESAGGGSISNHLTMHKSRGLFNRAIIESSSMEPAATLTMAAAEATYASLLGHVGCAAGASAVGCLQRKTTDELMNAKKNMKGCCSFYAIFVPWGPVVDGFELRQHPFNAIALAPEASDYDFSVPLLHGANRDEGAFFEDTGFNLNQSTLLSRWAEHWGAENVAALARLYLPAIKPGPFYSASFQADQASLGDMWVACAARRASALISKHTPLYQYWFQHPPDAAAYPFAYHSSEIDYVFDNVKAGSKADAKLASSMGAYWSSFAASGVPNRVPAAGAAQTVEVVWPLWNTSAAGTTLLLQTEAEAPGGTASASGHKARLCEFWIPWLEAVMKECTIKWPCGPDPTLRH